MKFSFKSLKISGLDKTARSIFLQLTQLCPVKSINKGLPVNFAASNASSYSKNVVTPGSSDFNISTYFLGLICCEEDRKSTRLNSSHVTISYAVIRLKKKK